MGRKNGKARKTYDGCVNEGNVTKQAAFVAGQEGRALVRIVWVDGLDQSADRRNALAKMKIPVTLDGDVRSMVARGGGIGHGEDKEGMRKGRATSR